MDIKVFELEDPRITDSNYRPDDLATELAKNILGFLRRGRCSFLFPISVPEIDDRVQVHCEKWIEKIGLHFLQYSTALQSPNLVYPSSQSANSRILKNKVYSGDVSGTIGEALFSLFLTKCFNLSESDFAHLKADKASGVYPDFAIYFPSREMSTHYGWVVQNHLEIPAEVKNSNEPTRASLRPRLMKAIQQIRNFWNRKNIPFGPSFIGISIRNQTIQSYDLAIIWR